MKKINRFEVFVCEKTGSDLGLGSEYSPFKTINQALDSIVNPSNKYQCSEENHYSIVMLFGPIKINNNIKPYIEIIARNKK